MAKLVTTTYGDALFELAVEENMLDAITEEINVVQELFKSNGELIKLFNHPKISKDEKISVLENVFKGRFSDELVGFLVIVMQKGRFDDIEGIFDYFHNRTKKHNHIGVAYITSAVSLSNVQKKNIKNKLLSLSKTAKIETHYLTDETLIGGMVIRMGDRVVDSSIKTKLEQLTKQLMSVQLA